MLSNGLMKMSAKLSLPLILCGAAILAATHSLTHQSHSVTISPTALDLVDLPETLNLESKPATKCMPNLASSYPQPFIMLFQ